MPAGKAILAAAIAAVSCTLVLIAPATATHVRSKAATPKYVSFVPTYDDCPPNNIWIHQAPVAYPSCEPPNKTSDYLTAGTPDANGQVANQTGFAKFRVVTTPQNDILVDVSLQDVRCEGISGGCTGALADYAGEVGLWFWLRITDHRNALEDPPGQLFDDAGTVITWPFYFPVPCAPTVNTTIGSTCTLASSTSQRLPSFPYPTSGARMSIELFDVRIQDGGSDGDVDTHGDGEKWYLSDGLWVP